MRDWDRPTPGFVHVHVATGGVTQSPDQGWPSFWSEALASTR